MGYLTLTGKGPEELEEEMIYVAKKFRYEDLSFLSLGSDYWSWMIYVYEHRSKEDLD